MKFEIIRSSSWGENIPCDEAKKVKATYLDYRTAPTLAIAKNKSWGEEFFAKGENHRKTKDMGINMVVRDLEEEDIWVLDFVSIKELIGFSDKYGELIIRKGFHKGYPWMIEIYDAYRE